MTLIEVVMALTISAIAIGSVVSAYILAARRAERASYTLAANSMAQQRIEQTRAAKWDTSVSPVVDELVNTNFPQQTIVLDKSVLGTNAVYATVTTAISLVSSNPSLKRIQSSCVWMFMERGPFTNSIVTYRCPDQ